MEMESAGILGNLAGVLAAALLAGVVSQKLRQPVLVGYLLAGMAIGPHGLGLIYAEQTVSHLAEIGVIMLMFALGVEFSLTHFNPVRRLVGVGGVGYIVVAAAVAGGAAWGFGLSPGPAVAVGFALALSSTVVVMQLLIERGEVEALHGRTMLGWLILQDLAVVPMLVLLPILAGSAGLGVAGVVAPLALALGKVALFLVVVWGFGKTVFPRLLDRLGHHPELFFVAIVTLCLGTAAVSAELGLSLALGAFLAGLVVSESDEHRRVLAEVLPLRDLFVTLFFVSVGMLLDARFALAHAGAIALVAIAIIGGKSLLGVGLARGLGLSWRTAALMGLGLAQIGEFSFVLAREAQVLGLLSAEQFQLVLSAAIVTMLATPSLLRAAPLVGRYAARGCDGHRDPVVTIARLPETDWNRAAAPDRGRAPASLTAGSTRDKNMDGPLED